MTAFKETRDAAIALGAAVWEGGVPSSALRRRLLHAAALIKSGRARWLIVTGGIGRYPPSEARAMQKLAIEHGVSSKKIILEETAGSTVESAWACSGIMRSRGLSSAWIVTDRYHALRSVILFRRLGVDAKASCADRARKEIGRRRWLFLQLRESIALPWSLLRITRLILGERASRQNRN